MFYRDFGNTGVRLSPLGFGMMRLPEDEKTTVRMVREAIDEGVNYIDTAYMYMNFQSEAITGRTLLDGYRDKIYLATKMPVWMLNNESDFDRILNEQLKKLQTDQIDFYLLHSLNKENWEIVKKFNLLQKMKDARDAGKICFIGFSFHDSFDLFKEIIDSFDEWDFCQIQLNYIDTENQAGVKGLKYASEKGLGVIIMEPLRGGYLANVPEPVNKLFTEKKTAGFVRSPVEWGFDFLWNMPEVGVVLSGMSTPEQVRQDVEYAKRSHIGMLTSEDEKIIEAVQKEYSKYEVIPCTGCNYCSECPKGIAIPQSFTAYNSTFLENSYLNAKKKYEEWVPEFGNMPSDCISCRACEAVCPQGIKISDKMREISRFFKK